MVTITLHCPHCGSEALVRDGHAPNGKQKFRCHACRRRSRENPTPQCLSRCSPRGDFARLPRTKQPAWPHAHLWCFSRHCVQLDQKKVAQLPSLQTTLLTPDPDNPTSMTLELDERMARLCSKKPTRSGYGSLCVVRRDKWLLMC